VNKTELIQDGKIQEMINLLNLKVPLPLTRLGIGKIIWCSLEELESAIRCMRRRADGDEVYSERYRHVILAMKRIKAKMKKSSFTHVTELSLEDLISASTGSKYKRVK
jgi:hypothetical protein